MVNKYSKKKNIKKRKTKKNILKGGNRICEEYIKNNLSVGICSNPHYSKNEIMCINNKKGRCITRPGREKKEEIITKKECNSAFGYSDNKWEGPLNTFLSPCDYVTKDEGKEYISHLCNSGLTDLKSANSLLKKCFDPEDDTYNKELCLMQIDNLSKWSDEFRRMHPEDDQEEKLPRPTKEEIKDELTKCLDMSTVISEEDIQTQNLRIDKIKDFIDKKFVNIEYQINIDKSQPGSFTIFFPFNKDMKKKDKKRINDCMKSVNEYIKRDLDIEAEIQDDVRNTSTPSSIVSGKEEEEDNEDEFYDALSECDFEKQIAIESNQIFYEYGAGKISYYWNPGKIITLNEDLYKSSSDDFSFQLVFKSYSTTHEGTLNYLKRRARKGFLMLKKNKPSENKYDSLSDKWFFYDSKPIKSIPNIIQINIDFDFDYGYPDVKTELQDGSFDIKELKKYNLQFTTIDDLSFYNNCNSLRWCDPVRSIQLPSSEGFYQFDAPSSGYTCRLEINRNGKKFGKTNYLKIEEGTECGIVE
jgi:hypothetical protein